MQVECFPTAPEEWVRELIGDVASVNPRYRLDKDNAYPFVEMANVAENFGGIIQFDWRKPESSGLSRFKLDDILFGKITPCAENGKIALVKELPAGFGLGSTEFIVLSPKPANDPRFIYALVSSHPVHGRVVTRMEGSTGRLRITEDTFTKLLVVPKPPRPEQEGIARILDAVDGAIERTRVVVAKAERVQRGITQKLLLHGVGKNGQVRSSMKADDYQDTRIGLIPKAWSVATVGEAFIVSTGFTLGEHRRPQLNRRKYLRVANVQRSRILLNDVLELEAKDYEMENRTLAKDDLLIVEGHANPNEIGRCARVGDDAAGLTFQNHLFRLRPKTLLPAFAELWLNGDWVRTYWKRTCASTSGLHTINQRALKHVRIIVPDSDEQERIVAIVDAAGQYVNALKAKLVHLTELKHGLLQDLLTGKVRVIQTNFKKPESKEEPAAKTDLKRKKVSPNQAVREMAANNIASVSQMLRGSNILDMIANAQRDSSAIASMIGTVKFPVLDIMQDTFRQIEDFNTSIAQSFAQMLKGYEPITSKLINSLSWSSTYGDLTTALGAQSVFKNHLEQISQLTALTQSSFLKTDWPKFDLLTKGFPDLGIRNGLLDLTGAYSAYQEKLIATPDFITSWPPFVTRQPAEEVYRSVELVQVIASDEEAAPSALDTESTGAASDELERLLAALDARLITPLRGAKESLLTRNPDRIRHALTSLRELTTQVLHTLSPDEKIKDWTNRAEHFSQGRPTRSARVSYVCRVFESPEMAEFVKADIKAVLALFELFQKGTHAVESGFGDIEAKGILVRTESLLLYLLKLTTV